MLSYAPLASLSRSQPALEVFIGNLPHSAFIIETCISVANTLHWELYSFLLFTLSLFLPIRLWLGQYCKPKLVPPRPLLEVCPYTCPLSLKHNNCFHHDLKWDCFIPTVCDWDVGYSCANFVCVFVYCVFNYGLEGHLIYEDTLSLSCKIWDWEYSCVNLVCV